LISHELKNILAIISEIMGLMDELAESPHGGMRLTPKKLRAMSESIAEEIDRANGVIRCMNTFAHSVDDFIGPVDLAEIISLTIQLVKLNPVSKPIKIEFSKSVSCKIYTSPFFLENFLYHVLSFVLSAVSIEKTVAISLQANASTGGIEISGIEPDGFKSFPTQPAALLAKTIGAEIFSEKSAGRLKILLPQKLTGSPVELLSDGSIDPNT
jgi:hypothetical protein